MKQRFAILILLALVNFAYFPRAEARNFEINPLHKVKDVIKDLRGAMTALIREGGNEARASMTHAFQLCETLIAIAESSASNLLEKTFRDLDTQQSKVFYDAENLINEFSPNVIKEINKIVDLGEKYSQIANSSVLADGKPKIVSYNPEFFFPTDDSNGHLHIRINGVGLHSSDKPPELSIFGIVFSGHSTDAAIDFYLPRADLLELDAHRADSASSALIPTIETAQLRIFYNDSGIIKIPFTGPKMTIYSLVFTMLPRKFGSFTYSVTTEEDYKESEFYEMLHLVKDLPVGDENDRKCSNPPADVEIDKTKTDFVASSKKLYGGHNGDHDDRLVGNVINTGGFFVEHKFDHEACFYVRAVNGFGKGGHSITSADVAVYILRKKKKEVQKVIGPEELDWRGAKLPYDEHAKSSILNLEIFGDHGREFGVRGQNSQSRFVKIEPDPSNSVLFLRPLRED